MDRDADWIKTQQELSEASKNDTFWRTMTIDRRSRMTAARYRRERAASRKRLKAADQACRTLIRARRWDAKPMLRDGVSASVIDGEPRSGESDPLLRLSQAIQRFSEAMRGDASTPSMA